METQTPEIDPEKDTAEKTNKCTTRRKNEIPVDRGWAWVICFASFLCYFVVNFSNQTLVVLFLDLVDKYDSTITVASLAFTSKTVTFSVFSALSTNVLMPKFGVRAVTCVAGFVYMLCSLGYAFSPSMEMFVVVAAFKGCGSGAILIPILTLLRDYFHVRRSLASSIVTLGNSVAAIISAPILRSMRNEFGISGVFLLVAALELHLVVAGLLLRPASTYKYRPVLPPLKCPKEKKTKGVKPSSTRNQFGEEKKEIQTNEPGTNASNNIKSAFGHPQWEPELKPGTQADFQKEGMSQESDVGPRHPLLEESEHPNDDTYAEHHRDSHQSIQHECYAIRDFKSYSKSVSNGKGDQQLTKEAFSNLTKDENKNHHNVSPVNDSGKMGAAFVKKDYERQHKAHDHKSSMLTLASEVDAMGVVVIEEIDEPGDDSGSAQGTCTGVMKAFVSWWNSSVFGLKAFIVSLFANSLMTTYMYIQNYFPSVAITQGATPDESAILFTVIGSVDFFGRTAIGLFADTHIMKPSQIFAITFTALGILCHITRLFDTFSSLVVMAAVFGLFLGHRMALGPAFAIEVVGTEAMPQALSTYTFCAMIILSSLNPVFGALAEASGNFINVFHVIGAFFFVAVVCLLAIPALVRLDNKKKERNDDKKFDAKLIKSS